MVPDHQAWARLELAHAFGSGDADRPDAPFSVDEHVRERADQIPGERYVLAAESGEDAAAPAVEAQLAVEEDERRLEDEAVVSDLGRREGQEAVRSVAAPDLEPDQAGERTIEQRFDGNADAHAPHDDGPADERAGPVKRTHPAVDMPEPDSRQTRGPK